MYWSSVFHGHRNPSKECTWYKTNWKACSSSFTDLHYPRIQLLCNRPFSFQSFHAHPLGNPIFEKSVPSFLNPSLLVFYSFHSRLAKRRWRGQIFLHCFYIVRRAFIPFLLQCHRIRDIWCEGLPAVRSWRHCCCHDGDCSRDDRNEPKWELWEVQHRVCCKRRMTVARAWNRGCAVNYVCLT